MINGTNILYSIIFISGYENYVLLFIGKFNYWRLKSE